MSQLLKMASHLASLQWPLGYFHLQPYWIQSKVNFYIPLQIGSLHQPQSHVLITKLHLSHCVHSMHIILHASDPHVTFADVKSSDIPYGRKFWRGIYFSGVAVLTAIRQYFICQKLHTLMSSFLQNHSLCTRPAARRTSLIVGLKAAYRDIASPRSCVHRRKELACLSTRGR